MDLWSTTDDDQDNDEQGPEETESQELTDSEKD